MRWGWPEHEDRDRRGRRRLQAGPAQGPGGPELRRQGARRWRGSALGITSATRMDAHRSVITDWMMPGLDGLDLCRKVRVRGSKGPYVYVILLTARNSREDRLKALQAGADDLLAKPLDRAELFARINVARRIVGMEEQLRSRSAELERMHAELERRNTLLAEIASCDGLTGLKNHRFFRESLERPSSRLSRTTLGTAALGGDDRCRPVQGNVQRLPFGDIRPAMTCSERWAGCSARTSGTTTWWPVTAARSSPCSSRRPTSRRQSRVARRAAPGLAHRVDSTPGRSGRSPSASASPRCRRGSRGPSR